VDKDYRERVIRKIKDPVVKNFWLSEYELYTANFQQEAISPIQNKVGQFLASPLIRNIVGQYRNRVDMPFLMDREKIFLCNLSKGKLGHNTTKLLGSLLITKLFLSALKRQEQPEEKRKDFYLYIDELQNFTTDILSEILSEARKYRLNLILTHQYLAQLTQGIKESIIGNVGTIISFRLGSSDAKELEKEFSSNFSVEDLENIGKFQVYLKLAIDGLTSRPFSAQTLSPTIPEGNEKNRDKMIKARE
jgi:hypothetical protein